MPLVTLTEVLQPALLEGYAVAGVVTLGWEDMRAYVVAAEAENCPVILQAGPGCREHTPLPVLASMFRYLAEHASVPVVAHLDHGYSIQECREAIDCGFSSVMFDGSRKPMQQNIDETAAIVEMAHSAGVSCEGEIGFVGYADGESSHGTDPLEASQFAEQTKWMRWRFQWVMCICSSRVNRYLMSRESRKSSSLQRCHWLFMVAVECRATSVADWQSIHLSVNTILALNCVWLLVAL